MPDDHLVFLWERYLEQKAAQNGVVRDDLPYSPNLDLIRAQLNVRFRTDYTHSEVYQEISHLARNPPRLQKLGLRGDGDVTVRGQGQ
jgi:hypothetical protein